MQRVADELAGKLAGNGLPKELQKQIGDLTKIGLVRTDYKKTYRFDEPQNGRINISMTISFTVLNYGNREEKYEPYLAEETFYDPQFLYLEYHLNTGQSVAYDQQQLMHCRTVRERTHAIEVRGKSIVVPRLRDHPDAKCHVVWRYRVTMPEQYSDITSFSIPITGITIELEDLPEDLEFFAGSDADHIENSRTWTFRRSFINGQHVRAWWFRKGSVSVSLSADGSHLA
jgi:hypothetical protein